MSKPIKNHLIGQTLQQAHLISPAQLDVALRDQKRYQESKLGSLKLGEIFALRGWLKQETTDFFVGEWHTLLQQNERQPLGYYLRQAGLLSQQQLYYLIEEQQKLSMRLRLGELAYLEGWLNPKTVDYFVKNLAGISSQSKLQSGNFPLSHKQQILQKYTQGHTDFQYLQLDRIYLQKTSLCGINLDRSELRQASLQQANLSRASLQEANLEQANLMQSSLKMTNLQGANLKSANLQRANLQQANLKQANLKQANLMKASLEGADLRGAKLQGAILYGAYYSKDNRFDSTFDPAKEGMVSIDTPNVRSHIAF